MGAETPADGGWETAVEIRPAIETRKPFSLAVQDRLRNPWLWAALLLVLAVCYYGSYVRHSLNFRDEGGTEALLAQRLLNGERPLVDLTLGYNVLWFYPIVGLFKLFGVNFVLLRGYCFALSTFTALCGFYAVNRAGRRPWLAFLVGLLLVLVPGMTFKNYMPLLAVTNATCLLEFVLAESRFRWRWVAIGGMVLGLTFLLRIDVGMFLSALWAGGIVLAALERGNEPRRAMVTALLSVLLLFGLVGVVHAPVYWDAQRRGFAEPFVQQYLAWPQSIALQLRQRFRPAEPAAKAVAPAQTPAQPESLAATPAAFDAGEQGDAKPTLAVAKAPASGKPIGVPDDKMTLKRLSFQDWSLARNTDERLLIILLYLPLVSLGVLALWAGVRLVLAWRHRATHEVYAGALAALLMLGCALTIFPQYFFFRPDSPHLSEFSPGFWVAVTSSLLLLANGGRRWLVAIVGLLLVLHAGLYLWRMLPDRWTGTIAARHNRSTWFSGANGVNVYVTRREAEALRTFQQLVARSAPKPDDYLIAYPYHPVLNVVANRPTYERNVYIDNATADSTWNAEAIARIKQYRPAMIVLSDWDINGTEASRFSRWAAETKSYIQNNYDSAGSFLDFEVYTRRGE